MEHGSDHVEKVFGEIVIADFGDFQIAIPSDTQIIPRKIFSTWVPLPKRIYANEGIVIWHGQPLFYLSELKISNLFPHPSPFPELKRLAKGIPISFEVHSPTPLPSDIKKHAMLVCKPSENKDVYYGIFRDIAPQSIEISPCGNTKQVSGQIHLGLMLQHKLIEETDQQLNTNG